MQLLIKRQVFKIYFIIVFGQIFVFEFIRRTFYITPACNKHITQFSTTEWLKTKNRNIFQHIQPFHYAVCCEKLFENDPVELKKAINLLSRTKPIPIIDDKQYRISKEQCPIYLSERFNEPFHLEDSLSNRQFPLAFTILMHENVEQFERLLRIIYRPQNYYCIHIDTDASSDIFEGVKSIVQCFNNVFLSSRREKVIYATFSRLQADLNCMKDLLNYPSWKYLLNIANSELPLRTNSELIKILSIYRGYNDIAGRWKTRDMKRTDYVWKVVESENASYLSHMKRTKEKKIPPPGNVDIVKGLAYGAFSRQFVEFVQRSPIAKQLLNWSSDTFSPDEHYWATLNFNSHLHAPGGYTSKMDPTKWSARYIMWGPRNCHAPVIHSICILSMADLPTLYDRPELFANKFRLNIDPIAYQCLEELQLNKSKMNLPLTNVAYYQQMPFLLSP